jgi:RES domain-containing protein
MTRVYRAIGARRWDSGDPWAHVPPIDLPAVPGRWNDAGQYTLYTSHTAAAATEEKRRQLARPAAQRPADSREGRTVVGSLVAAIGAAPARDIIVVSFEAIPVAEGRIFDGRELVRASFDRWLDPCRTARTYARRLIKRGFDRLIVPSSPAPRAWNSVFYLLGPGQPAASALPTRASCRLARRANVTSTAPDCPPSGGAN